MKNYLVKTKHIEIGRAYITFEYGYDLELMLSPVIAIIQSVKNKKFGIMFGLLVFNASITIELN
jgi:hypothetical protein